MEGMNWLELVVFAWKAVGIELTNCVMIVGDRLVCGWVMMLGIC